MRVNTDMLPPHSALCAALYPSLSLCEREWRKHEERFLRTRVPQSQPTPLRYLSGAGQLPRSNMAAGKFKSSGEHPYRFTPAQGNSLVGRPHSTHRRVWIAGVDAALNCSAALAAAAPLAAALRQVPTGQGRRHVARSFLPALHLSLHAGLPSVWRVAAVVSLVTLVCLTTSNGGQVPYMASLVQLQWYSNSASPAAPGQGQGLRGRVQKAGPVDLRRFYSKLGVESCQDEQRRWAVTAAATGNLTQSELADLRRTPCTTCQVFVVSLQRLAAALHV